MDKLEYIPGDLVIYASLIKEPVAEICEVHEASYIVSLTGYLLRMNYLLMIR